MLLAGQLRGLLPGSFPLQPEPSPQPETTAQSFLPQPLAAGLRGSVTVELLPSCPVPCPGTTILGAGTHFLFLKRARLGRTSGPLHWSLLLWCSSTGGGPAVPCHSDLPVQVPPSSFCTQPCGL